MFGHTNKLKFAYKLEIKNGVKKNSFYGQGQMTDGFDVNVIKREEEKQCWLLPTVIFGF
jgi:hypothetical protein